MVTLLNWLRHDRPLNVRRGALRRRSARLRMGLEYLEERTVFDAGHVAIGEGTDIPWGRALETGLIRPVDPARGDEFTEAAREFYGRSGGPFTLVPSFLVPDINVPLLNEEHTSLVMQWNPDMSDPAMLSVAAWQLDYPQQPGGPNSVDLTNSSVHFSLGVPVGPDGNPVIWDVSLELIDANGNSRGWFMSMPPGGWTEHWIMIDMPESQEGFNFVQSGPFDLSKVVSIRLDEAGQSVEFPAPPPGTNPEIWDWNAWDHFRVEPKPDLGWVHGTKFHDIDADGTRDPNEPGLAGWTIVMRGQDLAGNEVVLTTETMEDDPRTSDNEAGRYWFHNVPPGRYQVFERLQEGWQQSAPMDNPFYEIFVAPRQNIDGLDFGNFRPGSLHGIKFHDLDADGVHDTNEPGLADWKIIVDGIDGMGNQVHIEATTMADDPATAVNEAGMYWIDGLKPGRYRIREDLQSGWEQSSPATGEYTEGLSSGEVIDGLDFGNFRRGSIHGTKWLDINRNGRRERWEPGLAGWRIIVVGIDGMGNLVETTAVTMRDDPSTPIDEAGMYWIDGLKPGTYRVREVVRPGWMQTFPNDLYSVELESGEVVEEIDFGNKSPHRCDLNGDGSVDAADAGIMFSNWGGSGIGDLNEDGIVDAADAGICFAEWTGDTHRIRRGALRLLNHMASDVARARMRG